MFHVQHQPANEVSEEQRRDAVSALVADAVSILGELALQGRNARLSHNAVLVMKDELFSLLEELNDERLLLSREVEENGKA